MEKKRLLIVDDEADLAQMIKFRMENNGYDVLLAYDGQSALETARREAPDLIILDLMLPKMDGYKVCGLLKKDSRYSHIPIIIFTAKGRDDDMKLGEEFGADAYILKPFEPQALLGKIKELTERQGHGL